MCIDAQRLHIYKVSINKQVPEEADRANVSEYGCLRTARKKKLNERLQQSVQIDP